MEQNIALMEACKHSNLPAAEKALDEGAHVNYKDRDNYHNTPLDITSYKGNIELAKMLIRRGADVNSKNSWGISPLHIASMDGKIELAELLIENGADVNIKDDFGKTPLRTAINTGNIEMVNLLLSKGASIDKKDINSAQRENRTDIVNILEGWSRSMAILALQKNQAYNLPDMTYLTDLDQFMGKKGKDFGGRRRRTNKRRTNKRRRNSNKRRTNKRR